MNLPRVLFQQFDLYDMGIISKLPTFTEYKTWQKDKLIDNELAQEVSNFDNLFSEDHNNSILKNNNWRYSSYKVYNGNNELVWDGIVNDIIADHNRKVATIYSTSILNKFMNNKVAYVSTDWETVASAAKNIMDNYSFTQYDSAAIEKSNATLTTANCYVKVNFAISNGLTLQGAIEKLAEYGSCDCFLSKNNVFFKHTRGDIGGVLISIGEKDLLSLPRVETLLNGLVNDYKINYKGSNGIALTDATSGNIGAISRTKFGTHSLPELSGSAGQQIVIKDAVSAKYIGESYIYRTHKSISADIRPLKKIAFDIEARGNLWLTLSNSTYFNLTLSDESWVDKQFEVYGITIDEDSNKISIEAIEVSD